MKKTKPTSLRKLRLRRLNIGLGSSSIGPSYYLEMPAKQGDWMGTSNEIALENNGDLSQREYQRICAYLRRALVAYQKQGGK